ncbi:hypothetical protein [Clostridium tyrobutyricum]|uniref:hypothetical protein n=1 Tax=Clostridium tyrobutyricum TaxID=1519 RepID=UPI001C38B38A|nr:hypothetical protein [Clostridium tyrobutyricum]MBV4416989.1 hypothetical protein [Clostridium tyrobutyricum]
MREYEININEYNSLILHVEKTFKSDIEKMNIYKTLINGLKAYENKVINKKIEKIVQELFEHYGVSYYKNYGWYELYISKQNPYKHFEITLAPREEGSKHTRFKIDYLKENLKKLQEKHKKDVLNSKNIAEIVGQYNTALKYFRSAAEKLRDIPSWYSFNRFD